MFGVMRSEWQGHATAALYIGGDRVRVGFWFEVPLAGGWFSFGRPVGCVCRFHARVWRFALSIR